MILKVTLFLVVATSPVAAGEWVKAGQIGGLVGIAKACGQKINDTVVAAYMGKNALLDLKSVSIFNTMSNADGHSPDALACKVNIMALKRLSMVD